MAIAYTGNVNVEDDDFTMEFLRFIVRKSEIAFEITGADDEGRFNTEGVAPQTEHGNYIANVEVEYPGYRGEQQAYQKERVWKGPGVIVISEAKKISKSNKCKVKGKWLQNGDEWGFEGILDRYKA
ncbi:MAG: hypothetical protein FP833_01105 [Atribacteria sp.]|nr:hypothetical protein [Candidatus Atribacteria bacterium]MBU4209378.1 hypothetical protein [Pseudomonadota bacterium]MCG2830565.1 hypothetical protein [Desulfobacteraceae bacterium]MBU4389260.1 hypothetical protein [Pseudomonadota bacterium]MBU4419569.1 hypothetical protein [Pseudomonadota bacterium]